MSSNNDAARAWSWARCSGDIESSAACTAAICAANCSSSSSRVWGFPGKKSPNDSMNDSKEGSRSSPGLALLHHAVEGVEHLPDPLELLGVGVRHGLGHLVEEALGDLLAQLLEQLLEVLARLGGDEVVVLEPAHPAGEVGGKQVELDAPFRHDVLGDLLATLVAGLAGVLGQGLEPGPLLGHHLVELLGDLVERPAEVAAVELLLATLAQALHELAQALDLLAVGAAEPRGEQAAQRRVGVAVVEQVVGELGEQRVDLVLEPGLRSVPAPVVPATHAGPGPAATPGRGLLIPGPGRWPWPPPPLC